MKKENRNIIFFRYGVIVFAILLLSVVICYRLLDNTVLSAHHWKKKAEGAFSRVDTIVPVRGDILACDGNVLATNINTYVLRLDFRSPRFNQKLYAKSIPALSDSLARYFPQRTAAQWREYLRKPLSKPDSLRSRSFPVLSGLTPDQYDRVMKFPFLCERKRITGAYREKKIERARPYGTMARRSIGTLTSCNSRIQHGFYGLELALDSLLTGTPGITKPMVLTNKVADWTDVPAKNGYNVYTTIDINMQDLVETTLERELETCAAEWGTAILMEVKTGDIKAISNLEISPDGDGKYVESMNRAVIGFEPGSVIKTLSMLIALEDGIVKNLDEGIPTGNGTWLYHGFAIRDHTKGVVPVRRVLEYSSNISMAKIILRRYENHPGAFYSRVKSLGFLEPMHVGIAGERTPRFDSLPDGKTGERALASQAYGYATEIPPLFTASLYNAIANNGVYVRPRLVKRLKGEGVDSTLAVSYIRERICSPENAAILREMLGAVVWGDHGTARSVRSDKVRIGGKTGTARRIVDRKYVAQYRLAFCGIFPLDNPQYTCMVLTGYPTKTHMSAASTSGRVVREIAEGLYARGYLGDFPDYAEGYGGNPDAPVYTASLNNGAPAAVHSHLGYSSRPRVLKHRASASLPRGYVPDVTGLPLRQALGRIERAGYFTEITGAGHVTAQNPLPGERLVPGETVLLTLSD